MGDNTQNLPEVAVVTVSVNAYTLYKEMLDEYPEEIRLKCDLARCLIREKKYKDAIDILKSYLLTAYLDINAYILLSQAYKVSGHSASALLTYAKALEIAPEEASLHLLIARQYFELCKYGESAASYTRYLETYKDDIDALYERASAYRFAGQLEKASIDYRRLLELNPRDERAGAGLRRIESELSHDETTAHTATTRHHDSKPKFVAKTVSGMDLSDVIGLEHVKRELRKCVLYPLKYPELTKDYGISTGGGIVLYGPPGCGKTFIAKALSGEAGIGILEAKIPELLGKYVGESEKAIRDIFIKARKNSPCLLFFDEVDCLGGRRADNRDDSRWYNSMVDAFLAELDGVGSNNDGVLVMGATNLPWHMDPAMKRSGRLGTHLYVPPPDTQCREALFRAYLKERKLDGAIDYARLASSTAMYSAADIAAACSEANKRTYEAAVETDVRKGISTGMLADVLSLQTPTLGEWFANAKMELTGSNSMHLYPELLEDIKRYESAITVQHSGQYR